MKSILLVDDNPLFLRALAHRLRSHDGSWDVSTALNGREAIKLATTRRFDLIITDILMPEQDGFETICAVRRASPSTRIIAMTGGGERIGVSFLRVARSFGAHETLAKPFSNEELFAAIAWVMSETTSALRHSGQEEVEAADSNGRVSLV